MRQSPHRLRTFLLAFPLITGLLISVGFVAASGPNRVVLPMVSGGTTSTSTLPPVTASLRWSDPASWPGGRVPVAGDAVDIPRGKDILLDVSPPRLKSLMISGVLVFDRKDLTLTAGWIMLHDGTLAVGSQASPFIQRATITLDAADATEDVMGMGTRGILLMGASRLDLFGQAPAVTWTQLDAHAATGASSLTLKENTTWRAGDQIVVAPTDFYGVAATEQLEIASASAATLTTRTTLQKPRWGELQYVSSTGMTLTRDTSVTSLVLDQRAEVGNLTRNVVVQGADDALWNTSGFGAQIMAMEGGRIHINGVELRRVGQAGKTGRYPIHFHGMSYRADGTVLADASGQFVRNSTIWDSQNRCLVIHATNGLMIQNNICYDIVGHAIFLEDAVERRNTFDRNLILKVRNPAENRRLQNHEGDVFSGGSSGFWLTHPDNSITNNAIADTQGNGIWYALPESPIGVFRNVQMFRPVNTPFGSFANNVTHTNRTFGFQLDWAPSNDAGDITGASYRPTANGRDPGNVAFEAALPYTIDRLTSYKNNSGALWHRQGGGTFERAIAADNPGRAFAGSANCVIQNSVSIGDSLNNATTVVAISNGEPAAGMASYHSSCDVKQHVFVNLPLVPGKTSGVLDTSDYYIRPVDRGLFRDTNLRFINAHFGYRTPPFTSENWTLAGALWDPYGYVGPAGNYWVYDDPFLTAGTTCQTIAPAGQTGKSCVGPYYGLSGFVIDRGNAPWGALMPIEVTRDNGAVWAVGDGRTAPKLGNMRHAALVKGGSYVLRFPASPLPKNLEVTLENMLLPTDWAIIGLPFDGSVTNPVVYATTDGNAQDVRNRPEFATMPNVRVMQPVASIAEVQAATGDKYYQDRASNLIYIKLRHALPLGYTPAPGSDDDLYRGFRVILAER